MPSGMPCSESRLLSCDDPIVSEDSGAVGLVDCDEAYASCDSASDSDTKKLGKMTWYFARVLVAHIYRIAGTETHLRMCKKVIKNTEGVLVRQCKP